MIGETFKVAAEMAVKELASETAKEATNEVAKETSKGFSKVGTEKIDISRRIDVNRETDVSKVGVDIRKRIDSPNTMRDTKNNDISKVVKDYIKDLKSKSEFAETINNKIEPGKLELTPTEKVKQLREEFEDKKEDLRNEWEKRNNREWPRYKEDVYNSEGIRIRKAGDRYDAHHVQPLQLGGKNEASNITPLRVNEHKALHTKDGSCSKMVEKVIGGSR